MSDSALYFPYVNLPDDAWLKAAVLIWPTIGRMRPRGYYRLQESEMAARLRDELGLIIDVRPMWNGLRAEEEIDNLFYAFLERHLDELLPRYGVNALDLKPSRVEHAGELQHLDGQFETVHPGKMSWPLAQRLAKAGLLAQSAGGGDLTMHRRLAGVYLAMLADLVAGENGMTPITDQPVHLAATAGWTVEAMARSLLDDADDEVEAEDVGQAFALAALQVAVPRNLEHVPVERIIEARRRLLPELIAYREYLDSLLDFFVELSQVQDPQVRAAKLEVKTAKEISVRLETMERELGKAGLEPVRTVLHLQSLAPPAALGVVGSTAGLPEVVTGTGMIAACLIGASATALQRRREIRESHPVGYLLDLRREIAPNQAMASIRTAFRRATSRRRALPR